MVAPQTGQTHAAFHPNFLLQRHTLSHKAQDVLLYISKPAFSARTPLVCVCGQLIKLHAATGASAVQLQQEHGNLQAHRTQALQWHCQHLCNSVGAGTCDAAHGDATQGSGRLTDVHTATF